MADIDYAKEQLERGGKYEAMMSTDGWKLVQGTYLAKVADLTNRLIASEGDIAVFQHEVDEIRGLRKLITEISHDVDALHATRRPAATTTD